MRWMVGIDAKDRSKGAVACTRWLASRGSEHEFIGAHVVELEVSEFFDHVEPRQRRDRPPYIGELFEPFRSEGTLAELGSINASTAEDGLEAAAEDRDCDALIVGRRRETGKAALVRLGRVARRLLRTLPYPVMVVPPNIDVEKLDGGPILLGTDLELASGGAAKFASNLAKTLDLDLLATTATSVPNELVRFAPDHHWTALVEHRGSDARKQLDAWLELHGLKDARRSVVHGPVTGQLLEVADTAGASMIVVGSRGLSTLDRMFASSVGSELAASAAVPVVVVPGDWSPAWATERPRRADQGAPINLFQPAPTG